MANENGKWPLPEGWNWVSISQVSEVRSGVGFPKVYQGNEEGDYPFAKVSDISNAVQINSEVLSTAANYVSTDVAKQLRAKAFPSGTTVFAKIGEAVRLNRRAIVGTPSLFDNNVMGLVPQEVVVLPRYLFYFTKTIDLYQYSQATTVPSVRKSDVEQIEFPLAPLPEQERIVAEIEKQFSRLDTAVAALKRAQAGLARYKASVLKAAVEGRLVPSQTSEVSETSEVYEPATDLLARILAERRAKWEAANPGKKYKEPQGPDTAALGELPVGWVWASLPQLGELARGKSRHRPRNDPALYGGEYPFIQTGDVRNANGMVMRFEQTYNEAGLVQSRLWPKGTLCITIAANIADTAILGLDACFPDSIVGFIPLDQTVEVRFVDIFMQTAKSRLEEFAPATAQKNINLSILEKVGVPFPPYGEQRLIADEVDRILSLADAARQAVERQLARADRLRQAILQKAFRGEFV